MKESLFSKNGLQKESPFREVMDSAFRLLTRRDQSRLELAAKLRRKGFVSTDIDSALDRCQELGFLDDGKTAAAMAGHMVKRGYGILRVRHFLAQKGLGEDTIDAAATACGNEMDQVEHAREVLKKKASRLDREKDLWKRRQIAYRYLSGRGFPSTVINQVVSDL